MAFVQIPGKNWEYSITPETDDPGNAHNYAGRHTAGVRTNQDGTQVYVFCRQQGRVHGVGKGEIKK